MTSNQKNPLLPSMSTTCKNRGYKETEIHSLILPSSEDTPQWRDLQRARLVETRAKITNCQALLEKLDAQREELEDLMGTFTYPVLAIPVEITSHIFLDCLPANGRVQPSTRSAPLLLAQICRHWREVALSLPQLWSSVDLTLLQGSSMGAGPMFGVTSSVDSAYEGACSLLRAWFSRTMGHPLSITLRCDKECETILAAIAEFSKQWRRVEISLPSRQLSAFHRIRGPFPILYSFAIGLSDHAGPLELDSVIPAYRDAPELREIRLLDGVYLPELHTTSRTVTVLEKKVGTLGNWTDISQLFPNLVHLSASFITLPPSSTPMSAGIPPLESLIVQAGDPLPGVSLPHLRRLQYQPSSSQIFISFVLRSNCILQHLALTVNFPDTSLLECLHAVPSLVILDLRGIRKFRSFYEHLQSPALIPHLRCLSVAEDGADYRFEHVINMLRVRRNPHPARVQLRSVDLVLVSYHDSDGETSPTPSGAAAVWLQRLVADGLHFRVHTQTYKWPAGFRGK